MQREDEGMTAMSDDARMLERETEYGAILLNTAPIPSNCNNLCNNSLSILNIRLFAPATNSNHNLHKSSVSTPRNFHHYMSPSIINRPSPAV
jgi:hypothetical protein